MEDIVHARIFCVRCPAIPLIAHPPLHSFLVATWLYLAYQRVCYYLLVGSRFVVNLITISNTVHFELVFVDFVSVTGFRFAISFGCEKCVDIPLIQSDQVHQYVYVLVFV